MRTYCVGLRCTCWEFHSRWVFCFCSEGWLCEQVLWVVGWTRCFFLKSLQDLLPSTGGLWENSERGSSGRLVLPLVPFQPRLVEHGDPVVSEVCDCWNWRKTRWKHIRRTVSFQHVHALFSLYGAFLRDQSVSLGGSCFISTL